jgi:prephenate dehydratase
MSRERVAIQGEEGSNSASAARALLGGVELVSCASFREAFARLDSGAAGRAVLPIENTTAGLIQEVWDRLLGVSPGPPLSAQAEARVRISFVAACLPGASKRVRRVLAHPVAAAQCGRFIAASGLEAVSCHDTAGAARLVREGADPEVAALCPPGAAEAYRLEIFADGCGDAPDTFTRFFLIEPGPPKPKAEDDRSVLSVFLADAPGALARALSALSARGLNLCALHSRALPGRPGRYAFLLEVEAGALDPAYPEALLALRAQDAEARLLASFRAPLWPAEGVAV